MSVPGRSLTIPLLASKPEVSARCQNLCANDLALQDRPTPCSRVFWAGLPVSNLPAGQVMKPQQLVDAALKGLDRGEPWVFPSLSEQAVWDDYQKARQALVGGLMNGAPAARYAA